MSKPPHLDYSRNTYISLKTSGQPPDKVDPPFSSSVSNGHVTLYHIGRVGEMDDEHLYELKGVPSDDGIVNWVEDLQSWLRAQNGFDKVQVMTPSKRTKR